MWGMTWPQAATVLGMFALGAWVIWLVARDPDVHCDDCRCFEEES